MPASSVIHAEVDWEAVFAGPAHGAVSTLRKDPRTNSTTTMHLARDRGAVRDGRPTAGQQTFFLGPGQRVVGGQLTWVYADQRSLTPKLPKVADAHELLQQAEDAWAAKQNELINNGGLTTGGAEQHAVGAHGGGDAFDRAAAWASERRTQTAPLGVTRRDYRRQPEQSQARPLVYYDGKSTHVVDPLPGHEGPAGLQEEKLGWSQAEPPREATGRFTLGADGRPSTSQTQRGLLLTTARNPAGVTSRTAYHGLSPSALANQSLAGSIRTYGSVFKPIGHKEYEHIVNAMEGLNSWQNTQSDLSSSVAVGKPSRQMGPWEHTTTRLSLRRPTYFPSNATLTLTQRNAL